jgi:DNA-binding NarL/FixJ family response regulator
VVVLAADPDPQDLLDCARAGAVGYISGAVDGAGLRRIVRAVSDNEAAIPRAMVLELLRELRTSASRGDGVTSRESEVLGMLRRGYTTAEVAARLSIAPVTVRRHISELVHKLGVENRAQLTSHAA